MELKVTLSEVVKSVHAIEAVVASLEGQKTVLTNRVFELQAEIKSCTIVSRVHSVSDPVPNFI